MRYLRYSLILFVANLLVGCALWSTSTPPDKHEFEDLTTYDERTIIRCYIGRGVGVGDTFAEAFKMAKLIAEAAAVGININHTRIYKDGVYSERIRSRIRGTIHKHEILDKQTMPDGSRRMFIKVWVVPWPERPLFPNLSLNHSELMNSGTQAQVAVMRLKRLCSRKNNYFCENPRGQTIN